MKIKEILKIFLTLFVITSLLLSVSCGKDDKKPSDDRGNDPDSSVDGDDSGKGDGVCNHEYTTVTVAPTCETDGYDEKTCSLCGHKVRENTVLGGHSYEDGVCTSCGAHEENGGDGNSDGNEDGSSGSDSNGFTGEWDTEF